MSNTITAIATLAYASLSLTGFAQAFSPINPDVAFSNVGLLNTAMIVEHNSSSAGGQGKKFPRKLLRAQFASASNLTRNISNLTLPKELSSNKEIEKLLADPKLVGESFTNEKYKSLWNEVSGFYISGQTICPLEQVKIDGYLNYQKNLVDSESTVSNMDILKFFVSWTPQDIRCLSQHLTLAKKDSNAIVLLSALRSHRSAFKSDRILATNHATELIRNKNYSHALQVLLELQDIDPSYRLCYELIQRAYSVQQKGKGKVALKRL